jgi:hypothetical protein
VAFEHTIKALVDESRSKEIIEVVQVLEDLEYDLLCSGRCNSRLGIVGHDRRRGKY